jgi:hypothetical protein
MASPEEITSRNPLARLADFLQLQTAWKLKAALVTWG